MALGGVALVIPLTARAQQQAKVAVIGVLDLGPASARASRVHALRTGLRDLGYVEGKNIAFEFRFADKVEQLPGLAVDLVRMNVDVVYAPSSTLVEPARQATKTIPIVFSNHADPLGTGHVASLSRPGGNITGLSELASELDAKELEILTGIVPSAKRIGVLWNPTTPSHAPAVKSVEAAGEKLGLVLHMVSASKAEDLDAAMASIAQAGDQGLLVVPSPLNLIERARLADLALKFRLP